MRTGIRIRFVAVVLLFALAQVGIASARPTDGANDVGGNGFTAPAFAAVTTHFCYIWVQAGGDAIPLADVSGNGVPDYIDDVAVYAESTFAELVTDLGWRPPDDGTRGGCTAGHTDIYFKDIAESQIHGAAFTDEAQTTRGSTGYLILDNDYAEPAWGPGPFVDPMRAALANAFSRLTECGYGCGDDWMRRSVASWAEELILESQVAGGDLDTNRYLDEVDDFAASTALPITTSQESPSARNYGSAVWNHWLSAQYGPAIIEDAYSRSPAPPARERSFPVGEYDAAIRAENKKSNFAIEFSRFAAATAEWTRTASGFPDAAEYPDIAREAVSVQAGGSTVATALDHAAYRLYPVVPQGDKVKVTFTAQARTRAGVALVCRRGPVADASATVQQAFAYLDAGGTKTLSLSKVSSCSRVTAVIVNADARIDGFDIGIGDWNYLRDGRDFSLRAT